MADMLVVQAEQGGFWCGYNRWDEQLRKAQIFVSEKFANDIVKRYKQLNPKVVPVYLSLEKPAIEAEYVKHGRWVDRYGGKYVNPKYECSECRKEAPYRPKLDDLFNWYHEQDLSDYCPNCGAKMDGGADNED